MSALNAKREPKNDSFKFAKTLSNSTFLSQTQKISYVPQSSRDSECADAHWNFRVVKTEGTSKILPVVYCAGIPKIIDPSWTPKDAPDDARWQIVEALMNDPITLES